MVTNQPSSSRALWVQEPEVDFDLKLRICRRLLWDSGFDVSAVTVCKLSSLVSASQTCLQMFHLYVRISVLVWEPETCYLEPAVANDL